MTKQNFESRDWLQVLAFYFESGAAAGAQGGMDNGGDVQHDDDAVESAASAALSTDSTAANVHAAAAAFSLSSTLSAELSAPARSSPILQFIPKSSPVTSAMSAPPAPPTISLTAFVLPSTDFVHPSHAEEMGDGEELPATLDADEEGPGGVAAQDGVEDSDQDWQHDAVRWQLSTMNFCR